MGLLAALAAEAGFVGAQGVADAAPEAIPETHMAVLRLYEMVCNLPGADGKADCRFRAKATLAAAPAIASAATATAAAAPAAAAPEASKTALAAPAKSALADNAEKASFAEALKNLGQVDLSVPSSPAFAVLGITSADVQRPGTVRELGASLLRGFDDKGKVKTGMAFDFAPLVLVAPQMIVGGESYRNNPWLQAATRTTVSLATTEAADGKGSQLAWGLRVGVFDLGDPGRHYKFLTDCVRGLVPTAIPIGPTTERFSPDAEAKFREDAAKCNPATGLALWAEPALYVGLGQSRHANDGKLTGTVPAVTSWWATYSQGWDRGRGNLRALFQIHIGKRTDDRVEDPSDSSQLIRQDSRQLVTRVRVGKEKWHAFADLGQRKVRLGNDTTQSVRHAGVGAEIRVLEDLWLQFGTVRESGFADGSSRNMVTTGLRFGSEPLFVNP